MVNPAPGPAGIPADTTTPTPAPPAGLTGERVWWAAAGIAGIALLGFVGFIVSRPHHPTPVAAPVTPVTTLAVGSVAPGFALPRLGGGPPVSLVASAGTPTVVNFFASWCHDCQSELANVATLAHRTAGSVDVIGVDSNDAQGSAARVLLAGAGADYPVGVDSRAAVATAYRLAALPVTFFLDRRDRVVHVALGSQTLASLTHWAGVLAAGGTR